LGNAAALSCLSLLIAKLHVLDGFSLAWLHLGVLLLYQARLDVASASIAALVLAVTTGAWRGEFTWSTITHSSVCSHCSKAAHHPKVCAGPSLSNP
jgi:hypothetical protein